MKVKVWNDNKFDHKETYKGDSLHIKAGQFIEMEEDDAIQFRGQYHTVIRDADGQALPTSYKMLRMEKIVAGQETAVVKIDALQCQACIYKADSEIDLKEHLGTHKGELLVDEEAEKEMKARKARKAG